MRRQSRIKALKQMDQKGFKGCAGYHFDHSIFQSEEKLTLSNKLFVELRNLMLMSVIPQKLDAAENEQGAYLRATVSRVNYFIYFLRKKTLF